MIRKIYFFLLNNGFSRGSYLRKKKILHSCGKGVFYQPRRIPSDPKLVSIGNNVVVASQVLFINHDVMHHVFNNLKENSTSYYMGTIEIGNNIFIGSRSTILPNISICDNVIIASNSIIFKDIKEPGVYAGNPLKKVKEFDELFMSRKDRHNLEKKFSRKDIIDKMWVDKH